MKNPEVFEKSGKEVVLLGNEAIARGAVESGIGYSASYPGTPSSEIGMTLANMSKKYNFYFEWSTNEKVALESCAGASFSGVRSITAMKHFGFNVASDSIFPIIYTGVKAGMVIVVADDPRGHSSAQSEQDSRFYARMGGIPTLEPSNPQEAKDFTKLAFKISEEFQIPILLRTTTLVSHAIGSVKLGKIPKLKTKGSFKKDYNRYYNISPRLQELHINLLRKIDKIESKYSNINRVEGKGKIGVIASGVSYQYIKELGLKNVSIAKLNLTFPISKKFISNFIRNKKVVFVLEELEPIVESFVREVAKDVNPSLKIYGKNIFPRYGEYNPDIILEGIASILKIKRNNWKLHDSVLKKLKVPTRKPVMCPGCPHRSTFYAVKKVLGDKVVYAGDIGCYVLGVFEPFEMQDFIISMGASVGVSHGIKKVSKQRPVIFVGDSTFFHAAMPGIVNLIHNGSNPIVIVMNNDITAMTGHQPHPGSGFVASGKKNKPIHIEDVVKSYGIKNVKVVSAWSQKQLQDAIKELWESDELGVLISKGECRLLMKRKLRAEGKSFAKFQIDPEKCIKCGECTDNFACPAIQKNGDNYWINTDMCWGCGVCSQICPANAISVVKNESEKV